MADVAVFLQRGRAMSWRHLHRIEIQGEIERALSDAAAALVAHTGAGAHGAYYTPGKSGCGGGGSDTATPRRRPRPSSDLFRVFAAPAPAPAPAPVPAPVPAPAPASDTPASGAHTAGGGPRRPPPLQWVPDALGRRGNGDGDGAAEAAARSRTRAGGRGGECGGATGGAAGGAMGGAAAAGKARSRALFPLQIPQAASLCDTGGGAPLATGLLRRVTPAPPATGREAAQWQTGQAPREVVALAPTAATGRLRAAFSGWRE